MAAIEIDLENLPERNYAAGDEIITEGVPAEGLFFLTSGVVAVSKGGVEIHKMSTPGAVFGEMSYLLKKMPMATVVADTPCSLRLVEDRDEFIIKNPQTALYIARILAARLDSVVGYLVDIKSQFPDHQSHFGMIDEILESILNKHPRKIEKELRDRDLVDE